MPAKGYAIIIGLGSVDAQRYGGDDMVTPSCANDARRMAAFARSRRFQLMGPDSGDGAFITKSATLGNISTAMERAASELDAGDLLLVYVSGHGTKYPRFRNPVRSGEMIALYDGHFRDSSWEAMLRKLRPATRVVAITETCHGGGFGPDDEVDPLDEHEQGVLFGGVKPKKHLSISKQTVEKMRPEWDGLVEVPKGDDPKAWVLLLAACQANQLAEFGDTNGVFTEQLLRVLERGFDGDYQQLYRRVRRRFKLPDQSPFYWSLGPTGDALGHQRAFSI